MNDSVLLRESYSARRTPPTIQLVLCREHQSVFNNEGCLP